MEEPLNIDQVLNPQLLIWGIRTSEFDDSNVLLEGISLIRSSKPSEESLGYAGIACLINRENVHFEVEIDISTCLIDGSRFETWIGSKVLQSYQSPWLLTDRPEYALVYDGEINFRIDQQKPSITCSFLHTPVYGDGWFGIISRNGQWTFFFRRRETWHLIAFSDDSSIRLSSGTIYGLSPTGSLAFGEYCVPECIDQV